VADARKQDAAERVGGRPTQVGERDLGSMNIVNTEHKA
jgi:hypothetical protein